MKKRYIVLIVIAAVLITFLPFTLIFGAVVYDGFTSGQSNVEIESYRLCQDKDGKDVIIVKYLLENEGKEPTALTYEADIYVYQNGVQLNEAFELPKKCDYDSEDQYKNIKGGKEYFVEIAYMLENTEEDVDVELHDYSFFDKDKEKTFKLK
ncbi:MAG: DUF5067 domain-containing protein [Ruminococcaceae bacterium]|nr:DUF5067 domain-containing protein [Oscillospiraceae bacterium]